MKRYVVSRVYCTRMSWEVEANTEQEAIEKMDDVDETPWDLGDENWLGVDFSDTDDRCTEIQEEASA